MVKLIKANFDGRAMQFNDAGWFNATAAAKAFGKRPIDWLKTGESQDYIAALCQRLGSDPASLQDIVKGKVDRETRKEILCQMAHTAKIKKLESK